MKIAMIDPAAFTLHYDVPLCEALAAEGHDVTLYTTTFAHGPMPEANGFSMVEWFYQRNVPDFVPRRIARGLQHWFDMRRLARHLVRQQYDVVHVQWSVVNRIDVAVWKALPLPVVFTAHNSVGRPDDALGREALTAFDAVVAHSEFGAQGLREHYDLKAVWQVPIGAYDTYTKMADPEAPPVQLGDGPVVVLTGLLRAYKGVDVLLAAWPRVRAAVPDAQLLIAGRPVDVDLPETAPKGAFILPRFLDEPEYAWVLRRAAIVCLPYTKIDMSAVMFSAIALGRPMLLSGVGGFREFDGRGAEFVEPGNAGALAAALIALLGDEARRDELAAQAATAAVEHYSWSAIARKYGTYYAGLCKDAPSSQL
ncbi:MAG: glycosyltransferase family 4 protein [Thermoleophilia bacterium]|nr:glycosyltransferase family 4 protein [Thermoleophilia bacterium]